MKDANPIGINGTPPVLKMPPDLTVPALRVLEREHTVEARTVALCALRPEIQKRTLLNAYVLPSLSELGFFAGRLNSGRVTRFGHMIAIARDSEADVLVARQLLAIEAERVGLVNWLREHSVRGVRKRTALTKFVEEKMGLSGPALSVALDRLGKWMGFLIAFGVVRETEREGGVSWSVNTRHLEALRGTDSAQALTRLGPQERRELILEAYANASMRLGTRLYIPIGEVRDEIGSLLKERKMSLVDGDIDPILVDAVSLLPEYVVAFSPFSGPARGGLQLDANTYVGFLSLRKRTTTSGQVEPEASVSKTMTKRRATVAKGHR